MTNQYSKLSILVKQVSLCFVGQRSLVLVSWSQTDEMGFLRISISHPSVVWFHARPRIGSWPAWIWESIFRLVRFGKFSCCVRLAQPLPIYSNPNLPTLNFHRSGSLPNCSFRLFYLSNQGPMPIFWPQQRSNSSKKSPPHLPIEARWSPFPLPVSVISTTPSRVPQRTIKHNDDHPLRTPRISTGNRFEPLKTPSEQMKLAG
jgi:hypothetical protein